MENETNETVKTPQLEDSQQFREAIGVLARAHTELESIVKAQGELIRAMDVKLRTFVKAIDRLVGPPKDSRGRDVAN